MQHLTVLALVSSMIGITGQESSLNGTVRMPAGDPAEGIQVGLLWSFDDEPHPVDGTVTDVGGSYQLSVEAHGMTALLAVDASTGLAALACLEAVEGGLDLTLAPARRVFGRIGSPELIDMPLWTNAYVYAKCGDDQVFVAQSASQVGEFSFLLPEGEYMLFLFGVDVTSHFEQVVVASEDIDLGTINLPATNLAKLYGQPAPELIVTDARGIGLETRLLDFSGKYVLIEFWGHW